MGRQVFTAGEILTAASMNDLGDQTVMVFDDATARATAIPTPVEGMTTYLKDTDLVEVFDGSDFVPVAIEPDPPAILQVVSTTKTNAFVTSGQAFGDVTDLSVSITPSAADNKILVYYSVMAHTDANQGAYTLRLLRDSTPIALADTAGNRTLGATIRMGGQSVSNAGGTGSGHFLDTPATASALTYKIQIRTDSGNNMFVNRAASDTDSPDVSRGISSITVMEVAG